LAQSNRLSEQHPREQGLKPGFERSFFRLNGTAFRATSKRTRIETGKDYGGGAVGGPFRATSKRTRIETRRIKMTDDVCILSEQHPREQGLKLED